MKRLLALLLAASLGLAACDSGSPSSSQEPSGTDTAQQSADESAESMEPETSQEGSNILIAYFSVPEDVDTSGADAVAGASVVMQDGEKLGNTEYVANLIQQTVGGDLFRIETTEPYPLEHEALVDQAAEEQEEGARPELASHVENFEQYEIVLLGYPIWWGIAAWPVDDFVEANDFTGKTVIPFATSASSGMGESGELLAELAGTGDWQEGQRFSSSVSPDDVTRWIRGLGLAE